MELSVNLAATAWTLIPIILTIGCVFLTKRILLSMMVGIISASFMATNFNLFNTVILIERTMTGIIFAPSGTALFSVFSRWYMSIIIFLLGLGVVTSFVVLTGGARAFVNAITQRVKTRKGAQYVGVCVGVLLMIDDYFNAMVNGNITKTICDEHKLSRARSSYIADSIAAPICIIAPVSSWAVAIMGNMTTTFDTIGVQRNVFADFLRMIPYNFYVFAAIALVLITAKFDFNIFSMKTFQDHLEKTGDDITANKGAANLLGDVQSNKGTVWDFWIPLIALAGATIGTMIITGWQNAIAGDISEYYNFVYAILDNLSLSMSLLMGGIAAIVSSLYVGARHVKSGDVTTQQYWKAVVAGLRSMATPICILVLSWTIGSLIGELEVGQWVADVLYATGIYSGFIPLIMFISAALLAFSIGTSWGTFAIVLPIAGTVVSTTGNMHLLLPAMSAVLSGAVFGDHASPISDTTVLSAAGTQCNVLDHFRSQLPYAIIAAVMTSLGYLLFGLGGNVFIGYIGLAAAVVVVGFYAKSKQTKKA